MSISAAPKASFLSRLGRGLMVLIVGLGCGGICAFAPDMAAAIMVLQLPGVLVWLFDPTPGRAIGRTAILFQGAASVQPLAAIWFECEGLNACVGMATERRVFLMVLLAVLFGMALAHGLPLILKVLDDGRVKVRLVLLADRRKSITEEWDLGP